MARPMPSGLETLVMSFKSESAGQGDEEVGPGRSRLFRAAHRTGPDP